MSLSPLAGQPAPAPNAPARGGIIANVDGAAVPLETGRILWQR